MKAIRILVFLQALLFTRFILAADEPGQNRSNERAAVLERLDVILRTSSGACIVNFETDFRMAEKPATKDPIAISLTNQTPTTIEICGNFTQLKDIFGKETFPKFEHVKKDFTVQFKRPDAVVERLSDLTRTQVNVQDSKVFILLVPAGAKAELLDCSFLGPIKRDEVESVVDCINFIKQHPLLDVATASQLKISPNPWLRQFAELRRDPQSPTP